MHGGERLIPTARRASTWASASVIILSTAFLSPCNESMRCLPMNYGDVAMEAGVAVVAARAAPGGTRVALVRRSATEVELLCNALRARPAGQPGLFIGARVPRRAVLPPACTSLEPRTHRCACAMPCC